ncbi:MAG: hypothetical protein AAF530_19825 [Pseudomonadota bacterium]
MKKILGPLAVVALSFWGLQYTGPLIPQNEFVLMSAFFWMLIAVSGIRAIIAIILHPFKRRR